MGGKVGDEPDYLFITYSDCYPWMLLLAFPPMFKPNLVIHWTIVILLSSYSCSDLSYNFLHLIANIFCFLFHYYFMWCECLPACMSLYHIYAKILQSLEDVIRFPGTGVQTVMSCHMGTRNCITIPITIPRLHYSPQENTVFVLPYSNFSVGLFLCFEIRSSSIAWLTQNLTCGRPEWLCLVSLLTLPLECWDL